MTQLEQQTEALARAERGQSVSNYPAIFAGFIDKGIPEDEIEPRVNVFTYQAWKAKGRQVRKGEKGVRVVTWITKPKKEDPNKRPGETSSKEGTYRFSKATTVFHVTQTDEVTR